MLGPAASQTDTYAAVAADLLDDTLERGGPGGVVLAYGITASGKTFSLEGTRGCPGLVPQTIDRVYRHLYGTAAAGAGGAPLAAPHGTPVHLTPRLSAFEVYGERAFDLVGHEKLLDGCASGTETEEGGGQTARQAVVHAASAVPLPIREAADGTISVCGLAERPCASAAEAMELFKRCRARRRAARTALNRASSRSHLVFSLALPETSVAGTPRRVTFVDLAGSERAGRTGHGGAALKESIAINASLMALGRCLEATRHNQMVVAKANAGAGGGALKPVPYRDSAITHLLRDPLKGIGRLVLLVGVSPDACDFDETLHTLRYASIAARTRQDQTARIAPMAAPAAAEKPKPNAAAKGKAKAPGDATVVKVANAAAAAAQAAAAASAEEVVQLRAEVETLRSQLAEATRLAAEREAVLKAEVRAAMASSEAVEGLRGAWEDDGHEEDDDHEESTGDDQRKSRRKTAVQPPRAAAAAPSTLERVHPVLRRAAEAAEAAKLTAQAQAVGARVLRARNR